MPSGEITLVLIRQHRGLERVALASCLLSLALVIETLSAEMPSFDISMSRPRSMNHANCDLTIASSSAHDIGMNVACRVAVDHNRSAVTCTAVSSGQTACVRRSRLRRPLGPPDLSSAPPDFHAVVDFLLESLTIMESTMSWMHRSPSDAT
jgi:hypothetical protein